MASRAVEVAELEAWIDADPAVDIATWGGCFPEQWEGTIDGHSFYFREKRGDWSIELDLVPTGGTYRRLVLDDDAPVNDDGLHYVDEPIEHGVIIAEGRDHELGVTPRDHGRFIVSTVRAHLRRERCSHPDARRYCPGCGAAVEQPTIGG